MKSLRKYAVSVVALGGLLIGGLSPAWANTAGDAHTPKTAAQNTSQADQAEPSDQRVLISTPLFRPATPAINADYRYAFETPHPRITQTKARRLIAGGKALYLVIYEGRISHESDPDRDLLLVMRDGKAWQVHESGSLIYYAAEHKVSTVLVRPQTGLFSLRTLNSLSGSVSSLIQVMLFLILCFIIFQYVRSLKSGRLEKAAKGGHDNIRLSDIAGLESVKSEISEVIEMISSPEKYAGRAKMPKGLLLIGPPGNGKTTLAKAVANEVNTHFYSLNIADVGSMFVSVAPTRIRRAIKQVKKTGGILFIDEIDQIAGWRSGGNGNQSDAGRESSRVLNEILVGLDGFDKAKSGKPMLLIGATNRPEVIDPAMMRPGRLDRHINVPMPDRNEKAAALELHCRNKPIGDDVDFHALARMMPGFSMAGVANLVNEAGIASVRENSPAMAMRHFTSPLDRIILGTPRPHLEMTTQTIRTTAYHEAGHALAAMLIDQADRPLRATIVPHGNALGAVIMDVPDNEFNVTKAKIEARIQVALAGRAAEIVMFGDDSVTTGAENDRDEALDMIGAMVGRFGMMAGVRSIGSRRNSAGVSRFGVQERTPLSPEELNKFGKAVDAAFDAADTAVLNLIRTHKPQLEAIARLLLERQAVNAAEIEAAVQSVA